mgnify:CR=1 FL=1
MTAAPDGRGTTEPQPHRLTLAQFDELAAGGGGPAAIEALRGAQVSKRLLLLRAVRLSGRCRRHPAWQLLDTAAAQQPDAVHTVLRRPFVGLWATRLLRAGPGTGVSAEAQRYLSGLAAAAAVRTGIEFELPLPAGGGPVLLPGLGQLDVAGPGTLRHRSGTLRWDGDVGAIAVEPDGDGAPEGRWLAYRTVRHGDAGWEIEVDDLDPHRQAFNLAASQRLAPDQVEQWTALIRPALALIEREFPHYLPTVRGCLRSLVPVAAPRTGTVSASNQNTFGAVAVSMPADSAELALLLIHETQHAKLSALVDLVDLVDPADTQLFHAPWRADPRPAGALLQGSYAHAAVAQFWRVRRHSLAGANARAAEFEHALWRDQARRGTEALLASAALTPVGRSFVERLAGSLAGAPVTAHPAVREAVYACTTVTDVRWRLNNYAVPRADATELADAYRSGAVCPSLPGPSVRAGAPPAAAMSDGLAQEIRQRALNVAGLSETVSRSPVSVPEVDRRLQAAPNDEQAWALLALALTDAGRRRSAAALIQRPELARALAMRLPGAAPSALADWLAGASSDRSDRPDRD